MNQQLESRSRLLKFNPDQIKTTPTTTSFQADRESRPQPLVRADYPSQAFGAKFALWADALGNLGKSIFRLETMRGRTAF